MSSLRNAVKAKSVHRERHQPEARKHLGPLEKKKDYKIRARDQNEKRNILQTLHKKSLDKNPDEFHFHMINSEMKEGVHYEKVQDEELVVGDVTQDLVYITHRRSLEKKKIERLKAELHLLHSGFEPQNKHIIFVESEKEARKADPAKLLDTHPDLLNRTFNRLKTSHLASKAFASPDRDTLQNINAAKKKAYRELARRMERENKLRIMQDKLEVRKKVMESKKRNEEIPKIIKEGTSESAPIYLWPQERKR